MIALQLTQTVQPTDPHHPQETSSQPFYVMTVDSSQRRKRRRSQICIGPTNQRHHSEQWRWLLMLASCCSLALFHVGSRRTIKTSSLIFMPSRMASVSVSSSRRLQGNNNDNNSNNNSESTPEPTPPQPTSSPQNNNSQSHSPSPSILLRNKSNNTDNNSNISSSSDTPTMVPTPAIVTLTPTAAKTAHPSYSPSLTPTFSPTPGLQQLTSPFLSMTLYGMDMNIRSNHNNSDEFTREWRNLTSQHVLQFWLSFGESSLFHLGRVVTTFVEEARVPTPTTDNSKNDDIIDNSNNANANNNAGSSETIPTNEDLLFDNDPQDRATANRPDPLVIVYQQEIFFLPKNHEVENYPELTKSDLFTIPFKQDARSYTDKLRIISNNTHIVFMEYNGVVSNPSPPSTSSHGTNVIVIVVSVVLSVLVAVTGFILYLMRRKIYENHLKATVAAAVLAQQQQHQQEPSSHIEMEKPQSEFDLLLVVSIVDARIPNNENVDDYVHISESYENGILDATDHPEDRKLEMENGGALGPPDDDETLHPGPSNRHLLSLDSMHHHESVPMGDVEINDASVSKTMSHGIMMLGGDATTNINDEIFVARREHLSTEDSVAFPPSLLLTASDLENGDWRSPEQPFIHCNPTNTSSNHIHHHPHSNNYDDAQYTPDHSYGSGSSLDNPDDENYTNNDGDIPSTQQYSSSPFVSYNPVGESPVLAMDDVKEVLTEDVIQQDSSEDPHIPFMMAGFQLEIHDLE